MILVKWGRILLIITMEMWEWLYSTISGDLTIMTCSIEWVTWLCWAWAAEGIQSLKACIRLHMKIAIGMNVSISDSLSKTRLTSLHCVFTGTTHKARRTKLEHHVRKVPLRARPTFCSTRIKCKKFKGTITRRSANISIAVSMNSKSQISRNSHWLKTIKS